MRCVTTRRSRPLIDSARPSCTYGSRRPRPPRRGCDPFHRPRSLHGTRRFASVSREQRTAARRRRYSAKFNRNRDIALLCARRRSIPPLPLDDGRLCPDKECPIPLSLETQVAPERRGCGRCGREIRERTAQGGKLHWRALLVVMVTAAEPSVAQPPPPCSDTGVVVFDVVSPPAPQTFVVPPGVTEARIDLAGAGGGAGPLAAGGGGVRLVADFAVTPGETLNVLVGGIGAAGAAGGGGGGSWVYRAPNLGGLLIAAGGGGGAGQLGTAGGAGGTAGAGGSGGGGTGGVAGAGGNGGAAGSHPSGCAGAGGGGLLTDGGDAAPTGNCPIAATGGAALVNGAAGGSGGGGGGSGGFGGGGGAGVASNGVGGGGGGGGFDGGGGGAATLSGIGGGGGSYSAAPLVFSPMGGFQTGNGQVRFCFTAPIVVPAASAAGLLLAAVLLAWLGWWRLRVAI